MASPIRFLMEQYGLSRRQLADLLHTDRSTISRYLLGSRSLPQDADTCLMWLYALALRAAHAKHGTNTMAAAMATDKLQHRMLQAKQKKELLQHRLNKLNKEIGKQQQKAAWLDLVARETGLFSQRGQQRCLEELQYRLQQQLKQQGQRWLSMNRSMMALDQEIAFCRQCMHDVDSPNSGENLPNSG